MTIVAKFPDGTVSSWTFPHANDINKFVKALAENVDNWTVIEITITKLGPALMPES